MTDRRVSDRDFGQLEAKVEELEKKMDKVQETLDAISKTLSQAAGGWKALVAIGAIAGGLGAAATKLIGMLAK